MLVQEILRCTTLIVMLGSNKAFQSPLGVDFLPSWERGIRKASPIMLGYPSSQVRPYTKYKLIRHLNSEDDTGNKIIHVSFLDSTSNIDGVQLAEEGLPDDIRQELDSNQPSELSVLKNILGINIFTYILAGTIAFFFSMNLLLGPGWLGNSIGLEGTGSFQKVSDSLPETIDLSSSNYLL